MCGDTNARTFDRNGKGETKQNTQHTAQQTVNVAAAYVIVVVLLSCCHLGILRKQFCTNVMPFRFFGALI